MTKKLGPWSVMYPVKFYSGGDTTQQAFGKHIQEIERLYGLLNALDIAKADISDINAAIAAHNQDRQAHRNIYLDFDMINGELPSSRVTGNFDVDRIDGYWPAAKINGKFSTSQIAGLEDFIKKVVGGMEISGGSEQFPVGFATNFSSLPYTTLGDASMRWRVQFTYVTKTTELNTGAEPREDGVIATYDRTVAGGTRISGYKMGGKGAWKCWGDADGEGESRYKWEYIYTATVGVATRVS